MNQASPNSESTTGPRPMVQTSDSAGTLTRSVDLEAPRPLAPIIGPGELEIAVPPSIRDNARRAAFENELRIMSQLATGLVVDSSRPALEQRLVGLSDSAMERMKRDARYRLPRTQVRELLDEFCSNADDGGELCRVTPHTLVIVAHQDDETIGIGGQLMRMDHVTVVHVTNGAPSSAEYAARYGFSHPDDYAAARRREAMEALLLADVPPERMLCLGIPDGEVEHHMVDLSYRLAELIDSLQPEIVVTHPYEGGHTDHDAISFAVQLACGVLRREGGSPPAVLELTSYHNRGGERVVLDFLPFGPRDDVRTFRLPTDLQTIKSRMYDCFTSQAVCLSQFPTELERFRPAPRYNYTKPPHSGPLDYERLSKRLSGEVWRGRAQAALERLRADVGSSVSVA